VDELLTMSLILEVRGASACELIKFDEDAEYMAVSLSAEDSICIALSLPSNLFHLSPIAQFCDAVLRAPTYLRSTRYSVDRRAFSRMAQTASMGL